MFPSVSFGIDYIDISDPKQKKTPIAVTSFKALNRLPQEEALGRNALQMLKDAIDFTGYLKSMNPDAFLSNPAQSGIKLNQIEFRDWTGIGAELLITGGLAKENNVLILELRLIDTFERRLIVGQRYTGTPDMIRDMVLKFCGDMSAALIGNRGVFDSKIAFVSTVKGRKEIFTCDFDGKNIQQQTSYRSISLSPSWSTDGKKLAYVSYAGGGVDIFVKPVSGKGKRVVRYKGNNITPDWFPGQNKLAASLTVSGDPEIYLLTLDGEIIKRVTKSWGIDVSPRFSPDGGKIAFTSRRAGTPQIYIKDLNSQMVRRMTFQGNNNTSPAWSPDGRKIAYVGIDENRINIYILDVESGEPIQLTTNSGDNEDPSWSSDGSMIAFTSTRNGGRSRIFVMNASGSDQRQLLNLAGEQSQPDWSMSIIKR